MEKINHLATCTRWCVDHDDEIGQCVGAYQHTPLSLEPPAVLSTRVETLDGAPVIVTFRNDGSGATMTPQEAARYAVQLWALAAQAQAGGAA